MSEKESNGTRLREIISVIHKHQIALESRHIDDICFETGISVSEVTQILYELEQKRLIKQLVRNYYVRA